MFDFHTHVLPQVDDGSYSVAESLMMLQELSMQGVTGVAATPHFYANMMSPASFMVRRQKAFAQLKPHLNQNLPEVRLGAEVQYFEGICHNKDISEFCIEGTKLLLIEMPQESWTSRMISSLLELNSQENITVLLAHIERYLKYNRKAVWDILLTNGVMMQASADYFTAIRSRRAAVRLLRANRIHLLGTDCHNLKDRKPNMQPALDYITHRLDLAFMNQYWRREEYLLHEKNLSFHLSGCHGGANDHFSDGR